VVIMDGFNVNAGEDMVGRHRKRYAFAFVACLLAITVVPGTGFGEPTAAKSEPSTLASVGKGLAITGGVFTVAGGMLLISAFATRSGRDSEVAGPLFAVGGIAGLAIGIPVGVTGLVLYAAGSSSSEPKAALLVPQDDPPAKTYSLGLTYKTTF